MGNQRHQIVRILLRGVIAADVVICAGCSYFISFNLKNLSGQTITVNYTVNDIKDGFAPMLVVQQTDGNRAGTVPIPDDRISMDVQKGSVEFKLLANEEVVLDEMSSGRDYEKTFNINNLRIVAPNGSTEMEGPQVFRNFRPIKNSWYEFGPKIIGFVFEYH